MRFVEPQTFKPGDRVRIRISGECMLTGSPDTPASKRKQVGHNPEEDGRTGTVVEHPCGVNARGLDEQGHCYRVRRDGPPIQGFWAGVYAAIELDPATDGDPGTGGAKA